MLNHIVLMGRLTKDPELRTTQAGVPVATFTLACDRDYAPQGQQKEADFIGCVAWRATAEFVNRYFFKGKTAVVSGRLQKRSYEDRNGVKREVAEIVCDNVYFGDDKKRDQGSDGYAAGEPEYTPPQKPKAIGYGAQGTPYEGDGYQQSMSPYEGLDDDGELPF